MTHLRMESDLDSTMLQRVQLSLGTLGQRSHRNTIFPFFIPFAGCPHRCLYCAQDRQSGAARYADKVSLVEALANQLNQLEQRKSRDTPPYELAFYGGTFTALPEAVQLECLALAARYRERGVIGAVRCSTRPDAVNSTLLRKLRSAGLGCVELGVQSFSDSALRCACRGYASEKALEACAVVRESGLRLGIQLLPGMPGVSPEIFLNDVDLALSLKPDCMRFYPCLVIRDTPLAQLWKQGRYAPWNLETTLSTLGHGLAAAWRHSVPVIRLSLAPEDSLDAAVLSGPRHPALGSMIQGEALAILVEQTIRERGVLPAGLELPRQCQGFFYGHAGSLRPRWQLMGIEPSSVCWNDSSQGCLLVRKKILTD